ncbi:cytochrome c-type biogenesis protein CcmH [Arthrobacter sp. UKPF54-2]|uniref:cytochrome c-type biogenesis protein CcmH n=1 Tax=Arthrobacter sp. UKPF54-2 TaxID=2600159 RepID=UPI0011B18387|nr:cytochrome c-type biogenesis protein CcmH [Arthrobacter sp. UKPF54-2]QDY90564.1 cytochrome c-type biogenesis protein CcmH [Arthrobacter sp. UKPF54-2]
MLSLIVVAMVAVAAGFVVWANDKRHAKYGISVPAGIALGVGMLSWIIFMAAGFGYLPGLTWIPWILPLLLGTAAAIAAVVYLGRSRTRQDTARMSAILRL